MERFKEAVEFVAHAIRCRICSSRLRTNARQRRAAQQERIRVRIVAHAAHLGGEGLKQGTLALAGCARLFPCGGAAWTDGVQVTLSRHKREPFAQSRARRPRRSSPAAQLRAVHGAGADLRLRWAASLQRVHPPVCRARRQTWRVEGAANQAAAVRLPSGPSPLQLGVNSTHSDGAVVRLEGQRIEICVCPVRVSGLPQRPGDRAQGLQQFRPPWRPSTSTCNFPQQALGCQALPAATQHDPLRGWSGRERECREVAKLPTTPRSRPQSAAAAERPGPDVSR